MIFPVDGIGMMTLDLSKESGVQELEKTIAELPDLSGLINCAGYGIHKDFVQEEINNRESMVYLHDMATMRLCHQALAVMEKNKQ